MSKMKPGNRPPSKSAPRRAPAAGSRKRGAAPQTPPPGGRQDASLTSIVTGLVLIVALTVTAAAWMGGSMAQVQTRLANLLDGTARATGFAVNHVAVIGLDHDPDLAATVRAAAMIEPGENMLRADPHGIRDRVQATSQVTNVRVHRLWPDQVVIIADAAEPVALWSDGEAWHVVDAGGRRLGAADPAAHGALPRLAGPEAPEAAQGLVQALAKQAGLAQRLDVALRVGGHRWDLRFSGDTVVRLPEASPQAPLDAALARLVDLDARSGLLDQGAVTVDLRNPDRIYVRPAEAAPEGNA